MHRPTGLAASASGFVPHGHVGWGFTGRDSFLRAAGAFLADGVAEGQRVAYVGSDDLNELRAEVSGLARGLPGFADDGLGVCTVEDFYEWNGGVVDPVATLEAYVAAGKAAVAAGHTGLRVIIDVSTAVGSPAARDAVAQMEYLLDQVMSTEPISALCGYDSVRLGAQAAAEMAGLHPVVRSKASMFRLHASPEADFALSGELDLNAHEQLATSFGRLVDLGQSTELTIDARDLSFADHQSWVVLGHCAEASGRRLRVRTASPIDRRVIRLLALPCVTLAEDE